MENRFKFIAYGYNGDGERFLLSSTERELCDKAAKEAVETGGCWTSTVVEVLDRYESDWHKQERQRISEASLS